MHVLVFPAVTVVTNTQTSAIWPCCLVVLTVPLGISDDHLLYSLATHTPIHFPSSHLFNHPASCPLSQLNVVWPLSACFCQSSPSE